MPSIILLAAGSSSRMGTSKQLLTIADEPLLLKSAKEALQSGADRVIIVLGSNEEDHYKVIGHLPLDIIHNPNWQNGMGSSLKVGLTHLLKLNAETDAVIIMVCDQPLLGAAHLKMMMDTYSKTKSVIVASFYSGAAGVPALFSKSMFQILLALLDAEGAKSVIKQQRDLVTVVDFPEGAIDLDTPEDFSNFSKRI